MRRCDHEALHIVDDAPLSEWIQTGTFETLAECNTERTHPDSQFEKAFADSVSAVPATSGISKDQVMTAYHVQVFSSRCLASDDPRLVE